MINIFRKILFVVLFAGFSVGALAQVASDAEMQQAIDLMHAGKYDDAIIRFNAILKAEPDNEKANYELAFTFFASGKENEAIPYLEKLIKLNTKAGSVYDMLGSIYDDNKQPEKAIEYYLQGIKIDPEYQRQYFNIAIAYYRSHNYQDAEKYILTAIKLEPKHVSSQRAYAMIAYQMKKRGCSLMAWCSFLILEPQTKRSAEAYAYIHNILNYGMKKGDGKNVNVTVSMDYPPNLMMPITIIAATEGKKDLKPIDSLQLQLTSLFKVSHIITGDKEATSVVKYYADYFEKMANSGNMEVFARLMTLTVYKDESEEWFKQNDQKLKDFNAWVAATPRGF